MGSTSSYKIDVLSGLSQVDYKRHGLLITNFLFHLENIGVGGDHEKENPETRQAIRK